MEHTIRRVAIEHFYKALESLGYHSVKTEGKTYLEISKKDSDELKRAIKEMKLPFTSTADFVYKKIRKVLREYKK